MKRLLLLALLALGTTVIYAQEEHKGAEHSEAAEEAEHEAETTWKWANFGILAVVLGIALAKTLPKAFAERTASIQKDITEAQAIKKDAEARAAKVEAQVKALGADIEKFRTESAKEMAHEGERIRLETAAQIARIEAQAAAEIETAGKIARRELRAYSSELALKLAEDRLRAKLDGGGTDAALVDGFVAELGRQAASSKEGRN